METGSSQFADLLGRLAEYESVPYRLALFRDGEEWKAHTLLIEPGLPEEEQDQQRFDFDYGAVHFMGGYIRNETAAHWLRQRTGEVTTPKLPGAVRQFTLTPYSGDQVHWQRFPSHALVDFRAASQPLTRYDITATAWMTAPYEQGLLVADGLPFFPNYQAAVYQLIYHGAGDEMPQGASINPRAVVRIFHNEAWLSNITLSPTEARASVSGTRAAGTQLTISGARSVFKQQKLMGRATVACPLPDGLVSPLHIVVSRGSTVLDHYTWDERYPTLRHQQANVNVEFGDPSTEVEAFIAQGEGLQVEFKAVDAKDRERLLETVSAFANGAGGTLLVGIENGSGVTLGLGTHTPTSVMDTLSQSIRANITPAVVFDVQSVKRDGKDIIVIRIPSGSEHIHGVKPDKPRYYVRRGSTNFPARPEELENIILIRRATSNSYNRR